MPVYNSFCLASTTRTGRRAMAFRHTLSPTTHQPERHEGDHVAKDRRGARAEETRSRLLDAGLALLKEEPTEHLFELVSARRVIAKAGSSSGAYYHHFNGQDTYLDQLMEYALAKSPVPELAASAVAFEAVLADGGSFDQATLAGGVAALHIADTDLTVPLQLLV